MTTIKKGDVVQLKSGGQKMSVGNVYQAVDGEWRAECEWFDSDSKPQKSIFYLTNLQVAV